MKTIHFTTALLLAATPAIAHIGYGGRDFGTFTGDVIASGSISGQIVTSNFGWADGTDADFGDSHKLRAFRFTLQSTAIVSITATASTNAGTQLGTLLPSFSLYSGLAHVSPAAADHDGSALSISYLASLPGPAKEGAFNALETWKIGSDDGVTFADLSTFTFIGYAADGTAANFGPTPGLVGDGLADGTVTASFTLAPGTYSFFVGGSDFAGQSPTPDAGTYGLTTALSIEPLPEPTTAALLAGAALLGATRLRNAAGGGRMSGAAERRQA